MKTARFLNCVICSSAFSVSSRAWSQRNYKPLKSCSKTCLNALNVRIRTGRKKKHFCERCLTYGLQIPNCRECAKVKNRAKWERKMSCPESRLADFKRKSAYRPKMVPTFRFAIYKKRYMGDETLASIAEAVHQIRKQMRMEKQ